MSPWQWPCCRYAQCTWPGLVYLWAGSKPRSCPCTLIQLLVARNLKTLQLVLDMCLPKSCRAAAPHDRCRHPFNVIRLLRLGGSWGRDTQMNGQAGVKGGLNLKARYSLPFGAASRLLGFGTRTARAPGKLSSHSVPLCEI